MLKFNHNKVFFTSDTHFSHKNIIRYCDRPFASVEEMNKGIITMWNETVPKDGIVFHMGDVCFGGNARWEEMLSQLNGTIYLIRGNHDMEHPPQHLFGGVYDQLMIQVEGDEEIPLQKIFMHHFPFLTWPEQHRGCWQLFGHIHSKNGVSAWSGKLQAGQYDVDMDNNDYKPVSFQQVKEIITKQALYATKTI